METSDKIVDGLFLGPISSAKNEKDLKSKNITHILSVMQKPMKEAMHGKRHYKCVTAEDTPRCDLTPLFQQCFTFIDLARDKNSGVLVHCQAGMSRSATVVIAYLMHKLGYSYIRARDTVREKRPIINPNAGFVEQLLKFEAARARKKRLPGGPRHQSAATCSSETDATALDVNKREGQSENENDINASEEKQTSKPETNLLKQETTEVEQQMNYRCRKCRKQLFSTSDILSHPVGSGDAAFDWRARVPANQRPDHWCQGSGEQCHMSLFINPMPWMEGLEEEEGKLLCSKCGTKVGSFVWHGEKCPCGAWVAPAFHIDSKKIDKMPCQAPVTRCIKPQVAFKQPSPTVKPFVEPISKTEQSETKPKSNSIHKDSASETAWISKASPISTSEP